ncbi:hypothetical protein FVE85_0566 [Porphyridium purpureum]|uniref:Uncharacterized protein n=1 Tax=Porphyridium purpureum TaxID=35688 RepID=A0A5J4Z2E7_PORPP|nr:hypothetical protein FVE85_0566 [Porphyridium purpureum]|eukprot:POR2611..scf208_2
MFWQDESADFITFDRTAPPLKLTAYVRAGDYWKVFGLFLFRTPSFWFPKLFWMNLFVPSRCDCERGESMPGFETMRTYLSSCPAVSRSRQTWGMCGKASVRMGKQWHLGLTSSEKNMAKMTKTTKMSTVCFVAVVIALYARASSAVPDAGFHISDADFRFREDGLPELHEGMKLFSMRVEELPVLSSVRAEHECDAVMEHGQYADILAIKVRTVAPQAGKEVLLDMFSQASRVLGREDLVCVEASLMHKHVDELAFPGLKMMSEEEQYAELVRVLDEMRPDVKQFQTERMELPESDVSERLAWWSYVPTGETWNPSPSVKAQKPIGWPASFKKYYDEGDVLKKCPWVWDRILRDNWYRTSSPVKCPGEYASLSGYENLKGCRIPLSRPFGSTDEKHRFSKTGIRCDVWQYAHVKCSITSLQSFNKGCQTVEQYHEYALFYIKNHMIGSWQNYGYDPEGIWWGVVSQHCNTRSKYYGGLDMCDYWVSNRGAWHVYCDWAHDLVGGEVSLGDDCLMTNGISCWRQQQCSLNYLKGAY